MKNALPLLAAFVLTVGFVPPGAAVELLRWQRLPLAVPLVVGEERVVFLDRNVRVGVPAGVGERLRVQSAGGAIYLKANDALPPTRIQLQDVESGALILIDVAAEPARDGQAPLEPVRIVEEDVKTTETSGTNGTAPETSRRQTPVPVVLVRYAAQNLYAPLRTVEPVAGIRRVPLRRDLALDALLPARPVRAQALAAWRLEDQWVTAVRLTNVSAHGLDLDPRELLGDFVAASFQHPTLGPAGEATDTTVVYLVTRGHGLAESLWPAIAPVDAAVNRPPAALSGHLERASRHAE
ncbi:MAG: TIGR03749 family integrating conjugative element protein [Candidatus Accumulibacter sp.]|jgi:integrating conjugative element protein (TIGR03749 family)|nr:TIGR03749 family integrating conjugative element protein [Accumulibacter sp.]